MVSTFRPTRILVAILVLGIATYPALAQPKLPKKADPLAKVEGAPMLVTDPGGHTAMIRSVFFSPDGANVFTVSADKAVRVWDVTTGDVVQTIRLPMGQGDEGALFAGAISPDGKWIAVAGIPYGRGKYGILIHLISRADGQVVRVLKGHKNIVQSLAFSPNSKFLVSASGDGLALMYDVATGVVVRPFQGHTDRLRDVAFSPDGKIVGTISWDKTARLWNSATGATIAKIENLPEVLSVAFHPTEPTVAIGCLDGTIHLFKCNDGTKIRSFQVEPGTPIQVVVMRFSPDGKEILYTGVSRTGHAGLYNLDTGKQRVIFNEHSNTVAAGAFSKDGTLVATSGGDNHETYIWRTSDGSIVQKLQGTGKLIFRVGWRLDGKALAWTNTNRGGNAATIHKLEHTFLVDDLQFGPAAEPAKDFGQIGLRMDEWAIQPIDFFKVAIFKNGQQVNTFQSPSPGDRIYSLSLFPGNRAIIGGSYGLYMIDLNTAKIIREYDGHSGIILGVSPSPDGKAFLSGSLDQTICLWDPEKSEPLLSLFLVDRDWIAWTPQGYYASSPQGERLMGWQINNGIDKAASFHPAARFRASLYNPDLIKAIFREKNLEKAFDSLKKKNKTPDAIALNVNKVLPPTVAITSPTVAASTVKQAEVVVKAKAKSFGDQPVTAMRLLVDGRPYRGKESLKTIAKPKAGEVEVSWTIDLLPGKHQLAVLAESAVSKGISPILEVTRAGASKDELPTLYVPAVGVSAYPGDLKLQYAHRDAIVLEKTLKDFTKGAFKSVESTVLTDARANKKEILQGVAWLEKKMTAKDVAIVFFAGHGDRDEKGLFYFLPVDVDVDKMNDTCILGDLIKDRLANLPGRVIAMLDACHSGAATTPVSKKTLADDFVRDLVSEDLGVVVMCSSQGSEYSLESPDTQHGYFTLGVIEALGGKADMNKDRYIYLHEIDIYASLRVRQLSRGVQNPTTGRSPQIRSFPVASVGKQ